MILVVGATGSLGGKIVTGLLEQGDTVRALVRPGSDPEALVAEGATIAVGDLRDPGSLRAACRDVRTVISTASATKRGDDTPENVDGLGTQALIDAAQEAGAEHFVLISTIGASAESPIPAYRAKAAAEAHLRSSRIEHTIIQANALMDVWFGMLIEAALAAAQPVTLVGPSRCRHSFIAERDVASIVAAATRNRAARNATLVVGGPSAVSLTDAVQAYETAIGHPITVHRVAAGQPIPRVPLPVSEIAAALETYESPIPMDGIVRQYGVELTTVEQFAAGSPLAVMSQQSIGA